MIEITLETSIIVSFDISCGTRLTNFGAGGAGITIWEITLEAGIIISFQITSCTYGANIIRTGIAIGCASHARIHSVQIISGIASLTKFCCC